MYEFTNGIVVYDEKTRDRYIEAGYRLVKPEIVEEKYFTDEDNKSAENVIKKIATEKKENFYDYYEELNENTSNNRTIKRQSTKRNKISK